MPEGQSCRVLYMEDDAGLARLLQKALQRNGYVVDIAGDGESGLTMLDNGGYDVVLTDHNMPGLEGLEVIRLLAGRTNSPPVIMVTGNGNESIAVDALKLGATDYLVKDTDRRYLELLPMVIEQVMQNRRMVTEREEMFAAIRESEERYRKLVDLSPDGIAIHSPEGLVFVNPAGVVILGAPDAAALLNRKILDFVHPDYRELFQVQMKHIEENCSPAPWLEETFIRCDSSEVDVEVSGTPFVYRGSSATQIIFRDITERKHAKERLVYLANFDSLTGLPNRTLFFDRLGRILHHCRRYREQFALLFLDLDRFKWVNDTIGHDAGDELLQMVAKRMAQCLREADTVARMGGDEFTIILSKINEPGDTTIVAEKIIAAINQTFLIQGQECSIGVSIGISTFPHDGEDMDLLLKKADSAMYRAKEAGRNCWRNFTLENSGTPEIADSPQPDISR